MKKSIKVCTCILLVFLSITSPFYLQASALAISNLFQEEKNHSGKGDFVEDAVYFSLNQEVLKKLHKENLKELTLTLPFEYGKELTLHLKQTSFLAEDFKVQVQNNKSNSTLFYSPGLYYRGSVHGLKDAFVAFNIFKEEVTGVLAVNGITYNIGRYEKGGTNSFVLYKEQNLNIPNPFECSTEDPEFIRVERTTSTSRSSSNNKVKVYIECDYHLYKNLSSNSTRVMDFTTGLFNIVSTLYQKESITLEISEIKIWSTPDPYTNTSAKNARNDFGSKLNGNFNGDIAHLLSNYKVNGTPPNGGSANIDVLCNKAKAVSYTNITTSYLDFPTFSWTAYAVTHEIGHNLGSPHTHSCLWATGPIDNCWCPEGSCSMGPEPASSGTMMSYCHLDPKWTTSCSLSSSNPGINFSEGFGRQPGDLIRLRVSNASCLSSGGPVSSGPFSVNLQVRDESCSGKKDGQLSVTIQNGTAPYSYSWSNGSSSSSLSNAAAGSYSVVVTDQTGQRASASGTIQTGASIQVDAGADKVLGCGISEVILDARNSVSGFQYEKVWTKVGGNINGSINGSIYESILKVTEPGTYVYTITNEDNGCSASDQVVVLEDQVNTSIQINSTPLTCDQPTTQLSINSALSNGIYHWVGPNGFTSNEKRPTVNQPGLYQLLINDNGCSATGNVQVQSIISPPSIVALGGAITCQNTYVRLRGSSNEEVSYVWTGPNNFRSTEQNPITYTSGDYTLEVRTANGCINRTTTQVSQSIIPPLVSAIGGQLSCSRSQLMLQIIDSDPSLKYKWTGPNGYSSTLKNPLISVAGNYILTATASNGCSVNKVAIVTASTGAPSFSIQAPHLSCSNNSTFLEVTSNTPLSSYKWTGPNGFVSYDSRPEVLQAGTYQLEGSTGNGCSATASYTVIANLNLPNLEISANPITCFTPTTVLKAGIINNNYTYRWTGPNSFLSFEQAPSVNRIGTYSVMITGENGCSTIKTIQVQGDLSAPIIVANATSLGCSIGTAQLTVSSDADSNQYLWTGPNNFTSTEQNPSVAAPGFYRVNVTGKSGCSTAKIVEVKNESVQVANIITKNESCGNGDGSIRVEMKNPNERYEVRWSSGHSGLYLPFVPSGTYSAVITNSSGCAVAISTTVLSGSELRLLTVNRTKVSCHNGNDGSIAIGITGGEAPYNMQWSNGETGPVNVNLSAGIHSLEVEDTRGCQRTFHFDLKNPEPLEVIADIGETEAEFYVSGGAPTYAYKWSNGLANSREVDLENGEYQVTISDANGCAIIEQFSIIATEEQENSMGELVEVEEESSDLDKDKFISPNPADTYFNLYQEFEQEELIFISVFNAQGYYLFRKTVQATILNERIATSSWKSGTYYVQLLTKEGFITEEVKVIHN